MESPEKSGSVAAYYLKRIKLFLESEKKSQVFPNIPKEIESLLIDIVDGLPCAPEYGDDIKAVVQNVLSILDNNKQVYTLSYEYTSGEHGEDVLLYRKVYTDNSDIPKPLRPPCEIKPTKPLIKDNTLTTSFKLRVLNATVKFVKDDTTLRLLYPDMATDQAEFVMDMLSQGQETKSISTDVGFGYKCLYAPLWEAMKLIALKYDYKFQYVEPKDPEMKRILFEKIPKHRQRKLGEVLADCTTTNVFDSSEINVTGKPLVKLRPIRTRTNKTENSVVSITDNEALIANNSNSIANNSTATINVSVSTTSSSINEIPAINLITSMGNMTLETNKSSMNLTANMTSSINSTISNMQSSSETYKYDQTPTANSLSNNTEVKPNKTTSTNVNEPVIITDKARKLIKFMREVTLEETFIKDSLMKIKEFLSDESMGSVVFSKLDANQRDFLIHVNAISKNTGCYMLFSSDCQKCLEDIRYFHLFKVKYTIRDVTEAKKPKNGLKNVMFVKLPTMPDKSAQPILQDKKEALLTEQAQIQPTAENKHQVQPAEKSTMENKETELPTLTNKETSFVSTPPLPIKATTLPTSEKQLQPTAQNKQPSTSKTVKPETEVKKTFKEKLKESLEQPVQSEKATQMMVNMGWTGGALGLRGEGITEPIKLALECQKRAGLGHVAPQKVEKVPKNITANDEVKLPNAQMSQAKKHKMYIIILNGILELVSSDVNEVSLKFPVTLNIKICNFVNECVKVLNNRKYMVLSEGIQTDLATEICDMLLQKPDIYFSAFLISCDTVELRKSYGAKPPPKIELKINETKEMSPPALKRFLLTEIYKFYQTDDIEKNLVLSLNGKLVKYVNKIVDKLHKNDILGLTDIMLFVDAIRKRMVETRTNLLAVFKPPGELLLIKSPISDSNNNKVEATASENSKSYSKNTKSCDDYKQIQNGSQKLDTNKNELKISDKKKLIDNYIQAYKDTVLKDSKSDETSTQEDKKFNESKQMYILPKKYPNEKMADSKTREIQALILKNIDYTKKELPLLECQGIQNGCLVYNCQDRKSAQFLEDLIKNMDDLKIAYVCNKNSDQQKKKEYKLTLRINSYVQEDANNIFTRLELYNRGLKTHNWVVVKKEYYDDCIVICMKVDEHSFNFICESNFVLFSGSDVARFSIKW